MEKHLGYTAIVGIVGEANCTVKKVRWMENAKAALFDRALNSWVKKMGEYPDPLIKAIIQKLIDLHMAEKRN